MVLSHSQIDSLNEARRMSVNEHDQDGQCEGREVLTGRGEKATGLVLLLDLEEVEFDWSAFWLL